MRFNFFAKTNEQAAEYIKNRAKQLLRLGYRLDYDSIQNKEWGVSVDFIKDNKSYQVIYLLEQFRGQGIYEQNVHGTILTSHECGLKQYLEKKNIPYVIESLMPYYEYYLISQYYGDGKAQRSGVYFMNHIDEGLAILEHIGASELAKQAFCLHPLFQTDECLVESLKTIGGIGLEPAVLVAVMEYRSVANEYLSQRSITSLDEIRLSPLKDVNDMLIADKVQNRKDFELYHMGTHSRSKELDEYFENWMKRLQINYEELVKIIV